MNESSNKPYLRRYAQRSQLNRMPKQTLLSAYTEMLRTRLIDEKIIILYKQNLCHFQISPAGHEAIQVACAQVFRPGIDWFYPYYRDMALCAALGMTNREFMLNAMNRAADPNSHGRQMPMHWGSKALRIVNQSSPTGTQFLQAVGCALAAKLSGLAEVVYVSAGEGTCSQGDFHEAMNWAARERLPVVFVIQNNDFAISVHVSEQLAGGSVYKLCRNYEGLSSYEVDGTDFSACRELADFSYQHALSGSGPVLIEAHVPRLQSHSISDNQLKYKTINQVETDKERDPIPRLAKLLIEQCQITQGELEALQQRLKVEIDADTEWAQAQAACDPATALHFTFAEPDEALLCPEQKILEGEEQDKVFLVDALNHALDEELQRDPKMYVFGQDVAYGKGGVFTVTAGLTEKYGDQRVFNAPLAESSILGVAIGMATHGLRPVPEIQFGDYIWTAMMQIRNELAMMHYRSGGDFACPVVVRVPVGGYIHGACYHSQNIEATFAHFPGLHVVYPSTASDAKGLLKAAIRGKNPVLFLEHKGLYRQVFAKGFEGTADDLVPLGVGKIVRTGTDMSIVTWGALVHRSLQAAELLGKDGINVEVLDLRSIVPLDSKLIFESVTKTGRVLIVHEDLVFMGFGAEILSQITSNCFGALDAPPMRVGMKYAAAVPHPAVLEDVVLPQITDILSAAKTLMAW